MSVKKSTGIRDFFPRVLGIHTVRFRTAKRKPEKMGKYRDFSPANGGWMSPYFEFAIEGTVSIDEQ